MKRIKEFPFDKARRVRAGELESHRKAIEDKLGKKRRRRGRPAKEESEKYEPVSIRLHPEALSWAKAEAKKTGIGYQSLINTILLELQKKGQISSKFLSRPLP